MNVDLKYITHQEIFIDHDTQMCLRHEAVRVEDAEDGDGGGQEDAQHLGDEVSIGIVYSDIMDTQVRTIL